ncbi:MAG: helix-hairpin-helix domain-containing protein [Gemmatimonadaceae bacterium]|nr:helix-hairpin-helix domain-containing protein [Gemmatimonadaceae bacterium]
MSMTQGERRALAWLLAVSAVGAGVRVVRHWRDRGDATPASAESLARQLLAVDSAQGAARGARAGRTAGSRGRRRRAVADSSEKSGAGGTGGRRRTGRRGGEDSSAARVTTLPPVDLDVADSAALERLPRIGPALAQRIVAERGARGPFGSLQGLERVRGIGPKLAASLAPHVTFSGTRRPSPVQR